ncbi:hypothetical protein HanPSC8_Chr10g0418401 [Helianthus annuus]|nr:hypothetical protein HanPSC8_Chr10g0418401 [Helianthus annuus]
MDTGETYCSCLFFFFFFFFLFPFFLPWVKPSNAIFLYIVLSFDSKPPNSLTL